MVLRLVANIFDNPVRLRCAHAERTVPLLPRKTRSRRSRFVQPFGRTPFDRLDRLRQRNRRWQQNQCVTMIIHSSNLDRIKFMVPRDAGHVRPQFRLELHAQPFLTTFCRKNDVNSQARVSVRHIPSLRDFVTLRRLYPALPRWAKFGCPFGTSLRKIPS